jgi:MoaA/NifB/PqqE/SkfB family radical SAM enzyme
MITGFHIEPTNICTLKCAGCARTRFINQWPQHWHNHNLDIDQLLRFLDLDLSDRTIVLCGNYGDPIYHPDFINFVKKLKETDVTLHIVTNGSYRTKEWWRDLTELLTPNDKITFSIDGLPENFTRYRKNADWESIQLGIETSVASRCQTEWSYIPFSFNEDSVDRAEQLASLLRVDQFVINPSDRYDEQTIELMPTLEKFIGNRFNSQQQWKNNNSTTSVNPKCQKNNNQHFITADGFYSPCCYLADHRFYYKTQFGKSKKQYDIRNATLSELLAQPNVVEFYTSLNQQSGCQYNCPA